MTTFTLGSVTLYPYGLAVGLSGLLALLLAAVTTRKAGLKGEALSWFALFAVPLCVLGARLLYCLFRFGWFSQQGAGWFFRFTSGGFVLYGALAGGFLAAWLASKAAKCSFGKLIDALAAPSALMIALCRLAEGLAREGYGWSIDPIEIETAEDFLEVNPWYCFFPVAVYREMYDQWYWAVFVLEAVIALVICAVLLRKKSAFAGDKALQFLLMYAAMQALCESLRQDSVLRWGFVRCSQIVSALVVAFVLVCYCAYLPKDAQRVKTIVWGWIGTLAGMLVIIAMEFGVEKKIVMIEWLPMGACYLVMGLACLGLIWWVGRVRKKALPA